MYCLKKDIANDFLAKLKSGEISPEKLTAMTSQERNASFAKLMGKENASKVNALFESKLLLKNQQRGIVTWAKQTAGLSPRVRKDILTKVEEMTRILEPAEEKAFLADLAAQKIGTGVTLAEANEISNLAKITSLAKKNFNKETGTWATDKAKADYGAARVVFENYINDLKGKHDPLKTLLLNRGKEFKMTWGDNKARSVFDLMKDSIATISDASISIVASVDNSFLGRQGLNTLMTHPTVWGKAAGKSFSDILKTLVSKHGGQRVKDAVMADAYSRPNFMNGNYVTAKLIPKTEEQFPTTLPERLPFGLGRIFKASENAFINSAIRMRLNTFDILHKIAKDQGVNVTEKLWVEEAGKLINSITARGDLGKLGQGGVIRLVLWAPKMLKGNYDVLTAHTSGAGLATPFARQQARINLAKIVASTASIVAMANAIKPGSVELDPRSSDFLKVKVGNTRFDLTGGKASLITLVARAISFSTKSTRTGQIKSLTSGEYGANSLFDVGIDFLANKTTPFVRSIIDITRGRDFSGRKPTATSTAYRLATPIAIQNFVENFYGPDKDGSVAAIVGSVLDVVGINANTYDTGSNLLKKPSTTLKKKLGG